MQMKKNIKWLFVNFSYRSFDPVESASFLTIHIVVLEEAS